MTITSQSSALNNGAFSNDKGAACHDHTTQIPYIYVTKFTGDIMMDKGENFTQVLQYQRLKHSLQEQGLIKPDNSSAVYVLIAFCAGCIIGGLLPW